MLPQSYAGQFALDEPGTENFFDATDLHYKDPRSYQWNFTMERQFAKNTSARISYIGVQSVGMNLRANLNQQHAGTAPFSAARRPYLAWNQILSMDNIAFANFQGLQVEASRRFGQGLFFQSSYALSKDIGNAGSATGGLRLLPGEAFGQPITDRFNTRLDRGNLAGVRRHRFLLTGIYPLPVGKGRHFGKQWHRAYNALLGGWDLSTITVLESGQFQTPTIASRFDQSNTDAFGRGIFLRPDRIGDGNLSHPTPDRFFDITAFLPTPKGAGRFGNSGVGILRGPGVIAVAAGLAKNFQITEKLRMRMEGTFTNLPNHPNFQAPNVTVSTPSTFGKLTTVQTAENSGNRTGQVGIRLDF